MQAATQNSDRLRQIAILISSVDAATGRQLLLHFPTQTAKRVRELVNNLGTVTHEERQRVLADFQSSVAAKPSQTPSQAQTPATSSNHAPDTTSSQSHQNVQNFSAEEQDRPKWAGLAPQALLEFVQGERPTIIAVVISQLPPNVAVEILQQLPGPTNRDVLKRVAELGDIDEDAIEQIDEYLNERFAEYHKMSVGRDANRRRMDALIAAAPPALRDHWRTLLTGDSSYEENTSVEPVTAAADSQAEPQEFSTVANLADSIEDSFEPSGDAATILPFPGAAATGKNSSADGRRSDAAGDAVSASTASSPLSARDRSLLQLEFEQLLHLDPHDLATVMSAPPASTVLLALAGSTPEFMQRFYEMLLPRDAESLRRQMESITSLKLSDVDEAQREIVELMTTLHRTTQVRQAA